MPSNQRKFEAASGAAGVRSHGTTHHDPELYASHAYDPFLLEFSGYKFFLTKKVAIREYLDTSVLKELWARTAVDSQQDLETYRQNDSVYHLNDRELYGKRSNRYFLAFPDGTMADGPSSSGGIPLHEFRREVPPGWAPGLPEYPLRTYFERLKLWYRVFDGQDEMVGPLVAGRLQGKAQRLGMQLRLPRPDGSFDVGSDALVRLSVEEVRDPSDPSIVLQQAIPSGVQALCNALRDAFGLSDQELVSKAIEDFFEFKRGKLSLAEYSIEWEARLEEATTRAGLELNEVGKFYVFFRGAGLPSKFVDDIKLQLQGDLRRFQEARGLALRLITRKDEHGESYYQDEMDSPEHEDAWYDSYWADDGWSWVETSAQDYWTEEPEDYGYDYGLESWYEEDGWHEADYDQIYDDHPDYHNETTEQPNDRSEGESPKASESFPMKGKGFGCSVCGSRWHSAASCPVGGSKGSKGKGGFKGPPKGYGKGYGGHGKKGFSKSKGKGKGKWQPRSKGKGRSKGYHGFSKTLTQSFNVGKTSWTPEKPTKAVHFRLDHEDQDPVISFKGVKDEATGSDKSSVGQEAPVPKKLDFTFATFTTEVYNHTASFHTVRGEKRRGLLVDPGAASGLIGSETLRDMMEHCVGHDGYGEVTWCHEKTNNVSGISGQAEETLGEVHLPLHMGDALGRFSADVLGGEGSLCPALLSNPALRKQRAAILCDYFANGDGVLVVPGDKEITDKEQPEWSYIRLLLTDSGHYLLPTDDRRPVSQNTKREVAGHMFTWSRDIEARWSDVRHCFLQCKSRERERCELPVPQMSYETMTKADSNPLGTTTSTTSVATAANESSSPISVRSDATSTTTGSKSESELQNSSLLAGSNPRTTTSTTSGVFMKLASPQSGSISTTLASPQSGSPSAEVSVDTSHAALLGKPFLDEPGGTPDLLPALDCWAIEEGYLVRHHHLPRRKLFSPQEASGCPTGHENILKERTTYMQMIPRKRGEMILEDNWRETQTPNKDMERLWTGKTVFKLRQVDKTLPVTASSELLAELSPNDFKNYAGDTFPSHWDDQLRQTMQERYKAIPEEFYTRSGRKPITPANMAAWVKASSGKGLRWQFWELCAGSGRLSLVLMTASMVVGFPVDYRYGWDLSYPQHQELLRQCYQEFRPAHVFGAPTCTPWTNASNSKDRERRQMERDRELPTLEFINEIMLYQHNSQRGFSLEQPYGSDMLTASPISRLREIAGVRVWRTDQCMLGARDEKNQPVRKSTAILSNRNWKHVIKRCDNHRGAPHGVLQGQVRGVNRTAKAAVYPKRFCQLYGQDLWSILRKDKAMGGKPWPAELLWTHSLYYSCERCQLGRAAPPGVEHNMIPGQCRLGQPGMRRARQQTTAPAAAEPVPAAAEAASHEALPPPAAAAPATPTTTATPQRTDLESATGPFKFLARNGDYSRVALVCDSSVPLDAEKRLFLKAALLQFLRTCIDLFQKNTSVDYDHWLDDPVLLQVFQEVFEQHFSILGVMCSLRPWRRKVPDPYLSSACAPLRLLISGNMKRWEVHAMEDMRLMSYGQLHAEVDEADWHLHLFGVKPGDTGADLLRPPDDGDPDGPRGSSSRAGRPAAPFPASASAERKNDGRSAIPIPSDDGAAAPPDDPAMEDEEEFEAAAQGADDGDKTIKPLFDFKRVFKRLQSGMIESDPATAKRLLLGLHERFYHAPIGDFKNMLLRAGMTSDILPLAEEAVMSCSICRKYVRLPNRPQVQIGAGAGIFNHRVQIDLFQYKEVWILLVIDEATRYKAATAVMSKDFQEVTRKMMECWIAVFGPPVQLISDQEQSIMSHEAGRELERLQIERVPKGTTAGQAGKQHTGTGLVERHIGLLELTMKKVEAELDRQGIGIQPHELARECAMSHNMSLNYGGATPSMAVFGVLPRPFYQEDGNSVIALSGALQTDITPFERALRIRQVSLSMVQAAIAEDRVARANRSRPHQLKLDELIPGTTLVDYYREVQGDVGWRGPAELLKLNRHEGNAILSYQGRPYLVSLRHIRPHQAGVFVTMTGVQEGDLVYLRALVKQISPYKAITVGWVMEKKDDLISWRRASTTSLAFAETWKHVVSVGRALSSRNVGGAMLGQGVRVIHPPRLSIGVLLFWKHGEAQVHCHEHNDSNPITLKKITAMPIDQVCFVYVFYYHFPNYEPEKMVKVIPSEGYDDLSMKTASEMDQSMITGDLSPSRSDVSMSPTSPTTTSADEPMSHDDGGGDNKRKGPDSRTVVLAPESKRSRLEQMLSQLSSQRVFTSAQHVMVNLYWVMHWTQAIPLDYPHVWQSFENSSYIAQWDTYLSRLERVTDAANVSTPKNYLFVWPGKQDCELYADMQDGQVFKVDESTDNLEEACYDIWDQVEEADSAEVKQFVETKSFEPRHRTFLPDDIVIVDSVWVRKWKRMPNGSRKVKSRLCARGCFDRQKDMLSTRSTTATRLSQRILVSSASVHDQDLESWDISGAFLKGLSFEKVRELLRARGVRTPIRKVAIVAPANVWRHLATFDAKFRIDMTRVSEYVLLCIKPVYGLSDAPLAWQLCLHAHFEEQKGTPSLMDENYFYWRDGHDKYCAGVTTHVDDCGAAGKRQWLDEQYELLVKKFGKVTRQKLPFVHCGVLYSRTADGYLMSQDDFCAKLKPAPIPAGKKDEDPLTAEEITSFRSILGGLLWLTATRLDLVSDVCLLQSQVTKAKIVHLKQANNVVRRAQAEQGQQLGLHFRKLRHPLRLCCVHDSSAAGNVRSYAQEGILVLLCEDKLHKASRDEEIVIEDDQTGCLGGTAHVLWAHGAKAKRISYSTSHAETLAAVSGLEASTLVSVRLAELWYLRNRPSLQMLIAAQEQGLPRLPVDSMTDCRDFYELASGDKSVPQDKNQRLYVLAFREARMLGRLRWMILTPTESMTADALTKSMVAPPMMTLLSTGTVEFYNQGDHKLTLRSLPKMPAVDERHFDMTDKELIKEVSTLAVPTMLATMSTRSMWLTVMFATMATSASASTTSSTTAPTTSTWDDWKWFFTMVAIIIATERLLLQSAKLWWHHLMGRRMTRKSEPTPMDIDADSDFMEVDEANIGDKSDDDHELHELRRNLKHYQNLSQETWQKLERSRELCDNRFRTIEQLSQQLESERVRSRAPNEVYVTTATGKVYHNKRNCSHIRTNNSVRVLRPCRDCCDGFP